MKFAYLILCLLLTGTALSQSANKKKLLIDFGIGAGYYKVYANNAYNASSEAAPIFLNLSLAYTTHKNLALGAEIRFENHPSDSNTNNGRAIDVNSTLILLKAQYHFVNRPKSNLYVGSKFGVAGLQYAATDTAGNAGVMNMAGRAYGFNFGYRKYFTKSFGFHTEIGFMQIPLAAQQLTVNNREVKYLNRRLLVENYKATLTGINLEVGLTFNIGNNKPAITTVTPPF